MRQALVNENADLVQENDRYVMRITGDDAEGAAQLGNFIDPEAKYPVLVTTSRLLSTGVDAQTCRLIVLDRAVGSMTEFKQIVGRGTRVHEDTKKYYFTLIDFREATNHFADPDFDGEPVQIYEPGEDDPVTPPDDVPPADDDEEPIPWKPGDDETIVDGAPPDISIPTAADEPRKVYVDGVAATILAERVEYLDENGKLVTESLRDFTKKALRKRFASLDEFLQPLEGRRAQAGDHRGTGGRRPAARSAGRGGGQGPRPLRPHLPRRLRPAAAHPARARRERPQARRLHQVRPAGPRRARSAAAEVPGRRRHSTSTTRASSRSRPSTRWARRSSSSSSSAARDGFEQAVHELQSALYQKDTPKPMSVRNHVKSIQDIMRQDVGVDGDAQRISQLCWMFFLKIIDDQDQQLELMQDGYRSPIPKSLPLAHLGRRTPRASPATTLVTFINDELFPALKELPVAGKPGRPPPRRARRLRGRLQLHEVRPAHAPGDQQDQPASTSTTWPSASTSATSTSRS